MLGETRLQDVTRQMRNLLSCGSVHIVLGCGFAELRHPFLKELSCASYTVIAESGPVGGAALLRYEHVRALCDVALYKGQLTASSTMHCCISGTHIQSIAAAPIEVAVGETHGVLGLIICTDAQFDAFSYGERLLLQHYLPQIASLLVRNVTSGIFHSTKNGTARPYHPPALITSHPTDQYSAYADSVAPQGKVLEPLKNEFISMLSHELRSPLTAIKGYAILLQAYGINSENNGAQHISQNDGEELTPVRQREYLDIIMEQTDHLEVLISDLLDISRMQAGKLALRYSSVDVAELCQRVVNVVQQHADQQFPERFTFRCTIAPDLPALWTDAHRMRQILTNLLENAVKYSPEGGLIEILTSLPDTTSVCDGGPGMQTMNGSTAEADRSKQTIFSVTVRDHGIGIPLRQQPQLFQPFSRIEHPLTHDVPGMGLGLYITHKLVEAMGGSIRVESSEGKGTSITCLLPINQPDNTGFALISTC